MNFQTRTTKVLADPVVVRCYGGDGEVIAEPGDWWVRHADGRREFLSPDEFCEKYEPIPGATEEVQKAIRALAGLAAFVPYGNLLPADPAKTPR